MAWSNLGSLHVLGSGVKESSPGSQGVNSASNGEMWIYQPYRCITDISHLLPTPSIFNLALQASRLPRAAADVAGQSPRQHGRAPDSRFAGGDQVVSWLCVIVRNIGSIWI